MAPKRKLGQAQGAGKKSKPQPSQDELKSFCLSTAKLASELRDPSGQIVLAESFRRLVNKKQYPDYYEIIDEPISLFEISKKIHKSQYTDVAEFLGDFKLMLDNAATYNDPSSPIVEDATTIYNFVQQQCAQFTGEPVTEEENQTLANKVEVLLNEVIDHEFEDLGQISGPFIEDVDRNMYPDYFKVIKNPTSFNHVLRDLESRVIKADDTDENNLQRLYDSVKLIFDNAQLYNEPESLIYQDSVKLMDYFDGQFQKLKSDIAPKKPKPKPKKAASVTPIPIIKIPRPKKKIEEPEEPEEETPVEEPEEEEEPEVKVEPEIAPIQPVLESNVMGKTDSLGSVDEVFITAASVCSAISTISQVVSNTHELNQYRSNQSSNNRYQHIKDSLFPGQAVDNFSTLFEYQFPSNGYCTQAYTLVLPTDSAPQITLDFNLHPYLQSLERPNYSIPANDDFQCNLLVNDSTIDTVGDIEDGDSLKLHYEVKLSYGLNIINFECKVSPNVSKVIKKSQAPKAEPEELGGRHTRHQLQQYKRSWEVEKLTFYIVSSS